MPKANNKNPRLTPTVIKAARAALGWRQADLAACCGREPSTIAYYEAGKIAPTSQSYWGLRGAFENNGITFLIEKNRIVGIRWSKP